jgi:hypothetical protein
MTAVCQLCGATVHGKPVAETHGVDPASPDGQMLDYDTLSAYMWLHISENHPNQVEEGIMQQRRAAKMYAMNWATIPGALEATRRQHRANLIIALSVTTQFAGDNTTAPDQDAAAGAAGSASEPVASSGGTNEKKSFRNASN